MPQTRVLVTENHGSERSARAFNMALHVRLTWLCTARTCSLQGSAQFARALNMAPPALHVCSTGLYTACTCVKQGSAQPARAFYTAPLALHLL